MPSPKRFVLAENWRGALSPLPSLLSEEDMDKESLLELIIWHVSAIDFGAC